MADVKTNVLTVDSVDKIIEQLEAQVKELEEKKAQLDAQIKSHKKIKAILEAGK